MTSDQLQQALFQHVKAVLPPHVSLADEIADLLHISVDSAYRRIRGEKPISLDEIQKIASRYKLSLDQFLHLQSDSFLFSGRLANSSDFNFEDYLKEMLRQLEFMNGFKTKHFYYLLKDIPPMTHFQVPELVAFKAFFWKKSILHYETMRGKKFDITDIDPQHIELARKIVFWYNKIPSTEIWNIESVNSTITQIMFYHDAHAFVHPDTAKQLLQKVEELIDHIERQAETGLKFSINEKPLSDAGSYRMFNNELILGDNTIFLELDNMRITYLVHSVINFMTTRDEQFNTYMYNVLQNLISRSSQISSVGEKERAHFFERIREKLAQTYSRL